ncbi:MAG: hypothetical protein ACFFBD_27955 [Candidatus Hodarchaeota archaeon]
MSATTRLWNWNPEIKTLGVVLRVILLATVLGISISLATGFLVYYTFDATETFLILYSPLLIFLYQ